MNDTTAFFVRFPRTADELRRPHLADSERPYEVVKTVGLAAVDYDNFINDMTADRQFLSDYAAVCSSGQTMKCLFVRRRGKSDGILVVPDVPGRPAHVGWAAYSAQSDDRQRPSAEPNR